MKVAGLGRSKLGQKTHSCQWANTYTRAFTGIHPPHPHNTHTPSLFLSLSHTHTHTQTGAHADTNIQTKNKENTSQRKRLGTFHNEAECFDVRGARAPLHAARVFTGVLQLGVGDQQNSSLLGVLRLARDRPVVAAPGVVQGQSADQTRLEYSLLANSKHWFTTSILKPLS